MTTTKVMSIVQVVFSVGLLIAGIIAASYKVPTWCNENEDLNGNPDDIWNQTPEEECKDDHDDLNGTVRSIALWGTVPGILPLLVGAFGVFASMKKAKWMIGVMLALVIVGCILCIIGIFVPFIGAAIFQAICDNDWDPDNPQSGEIRSTSEGRDFCDRYTGSLWAVVVFNIILAVFQFSFSIVLCCLCCANDTVWSQGTGGGAPPGVPMQPISSTQPMSPTDPAYSQAYGQNNPPPAYGQPTQAYIPEAQAVK